MNEFLKRNSQQKIDSINRKKYQRIYTIKCLSPAMYIIECPKCGNICASASERSIMPQFSTCDDESCNY